MSTNIQRSANFISIKNKNKGATVPINVLLLIIERLHPVWRKTDVVDSKQSSRNRSQKFYTEASIIDWLLLSWFFDIDETGRTSVCVDDPLTTLAVFFSSRFNTSSAAVVGQYFYRFVVYSPSIDGIKSSFFFPVLFYIPACERNCLRSLIMACVSNVRHRRHALLKVGRTTVMWSMMTN